MTVREKIPILGERLRRQNLAVPDSTPYDDLFRLMSPVPTLHWVEPGSPPAIQFRSKRDDADLNDERRANRILIKGRFRGGKVGYIFKDELPLHRAAYKRELASLTQTDETVMETLRQEGGMNIGLIKEITGLKTKDISASLQKWQKAFVVFEDQIERDNDRAFYILEDEFYDTDLNAWKRRDAMAELIRRFFHLNVWADLSMIKSFTQFPSRDLKEVVSLLTGSGELVPVTLDTGEPGFMVNADYEAARDWGTDMGDRIFVLDLNDYYVCSHESALKKRYARKDLKTLKYLMRRGEFIGALYGFFRFGPDDLEDLVLDLPPEETAALGPEAIEAVYQVYTAPEHRLKRFGGVAI